MNCWWVVIQVGIFGAAIQSCWFVLLLQPFFLMKILNCMWCSHCHTLYAIQNLLEGVHFATFIQLKASYGVHPRVIYTSSERHDDGWCRWG